MGGERKVQIQARASVYDAMPIIWPISYGPYDMKVYVDLRSNDLLFSYFGHMLVRI